MRKFMLIGGAGTVGRYLQKHLKKQGEDYISLDIVYDNENRIHILNGMNVLKHFATHQPTHVILLAAAVGRKHVSNTEFDSMKINIEGAFNVIKACIYLKCKLTYIGTSESYGSHFESPYVSMKEFGIHTDFPLFRGVYGFTKLVAEKLVQHYGYNHEMDYSIARLFMCYAPVGSKVNYQTAISRMFKSAIINEPIEVHRNTSRSWCYITDIVDGIYKVAAQGNGMYNIGNPNETISSEDLAKKIIKIAGSKSIIKLCEPDRDIYRHKNFSVELAKSELNFEPKVKLDEGLKWVYQAMKK